MDCVNFKVSLIDDSEVEQDSHSSKDFLLQSTQVGQIKSLGVLTLRSC